MLPKFQKGFIHLGIFGILLLVGAVAVGTRLVSNPELIFNIGEQAKAPEGKEACEAAGCPWVWKNGRCKKTEANCGGGSKGVNITCTGGGLRCVTGEGVGACLGQNLVSRTGNCGKNEVCCGPKPETPPGSDGDEGSGECEPGEPATKEGCTTTGTNGLTCAGTRTLTCNRVTKKWIKSSSCECDEAAPGGGGDYPTPPKDPYCSDFMKNDCRQESKDCEPTSTGGKCVAKTQITPISTDPYCSPFMSNDCRAEGKKCEPTTSGGKCVDKTIGPGGYHCEKVSGKEYSVPANPSRADPAQPCGYGCITSTGKCKSGEQARDERAGKTWYRCIANFSIENGYNQYGDAYIGNIDFCGGSWCDRSTGRCSTTPKKENGERCTSYVECQGRHCIDRVDDSINGPVCQD